VPLGGADLVAPVDTPMPKRETVITDQTITSRPGSDIQNVVPFPVNAGSWANAAPRAIMELAPDGSHVRSWRLRTWCGLDRSDRPVQP